MSHHWFLLSRTHLLAHVVPPAPAVSTHLLMCSWLISSTRIALRRADAMNPLINAAVSRAERQARHHGTHIRSKIYHRIDVPKQETDHL